MRQIQWLLAGTLVLTGCGDDFPPENPCQFEGLTERGSAGEVIGDIDSGDWLSDGDIGSAYAYPNPCNTAAGSAVSVVVDVRFAGTLSIEIYDTGCNLVRRTEASVESGTVTTEIRNDQSGNTLGGIYRVSIELDREGTHSQTFGDIRLYAE